MLAIRIHLSGLKETKWHEYTLRFVGGGVATVVAGSIASKWGPVIGGLFLAFPAIFPASATLIESHERERKQKQGLHGAKRGRDAAAIDALGTAIGSVGLAAFACICWLFMPHHPAPEALVVSTAAWLMVSPGIWAVRQRRRRLRFERALAGRI